MDVIKSYPGTCSRLLPLVRINSFRFHSEPRRERVGLTIFVEGNLVTLHPRGALLPQLCPHSACIPSILVDVEAAVVTVKGGDVHTALSVLGYSRPENTRVLL